MITCSIEPIEYDELLGYMSLQAVDAFPSFGDEQFLNAFATKLHTYAEFCLSRENGQLVGMIAFYANGRGADFVYIPHVYVSSGCRKKGIFTQMLQTVTDYVKVKGFKSIRLEVRKDNLVAYNAYKKFGFVYDGEASKDSLYMVLK